MRTSTSRILIFKSIIENPVVTNHTFFTVITFWKINSFAYINSIVKTFTKPNLHQSQKDCHQNNKSFGRIQFYKDSCLYILASNICCHKTSNESLEITVKDLHSTPSSGTLKPQKLV